MISASIGSQALVQRCIAGRVQCAILKSFSPCGFLQSPLSCIRAFHRLKTAQGMRFAFGRKDRSGGMNTPGRQWHAAFLTAPRRRRCCWPRGHMLSTDGVEMPSTEGPG